MTALVDTQAEAPGQLAIVWCRFCPEAATAPDELCDPHRAGVPAAIIEPWLAKQAMTALRDRITYAPHCAHCTAMVHWFRGEAYTSWDAARAAQKARR